VYKFIPPRRGQCHWFGHTMRLHTQHNYGRMISHSRQPWGQGSLCRYFTLRAEVTSLTGEGPCAAKPPSRQGAC
jgi:hypothetical protein